VIIVDRGRVLVEGRPGELIRRFAGREVVEVSFPSEELRRFVRDRGYDHEDLGNRLIVYSTDGGDLYQVISQKYCEEGCHLRQASLEDVFLKLTGRGLRD
jgi:lipooligosaccharide transport system ATP-binding protein